MIRRIIQTALLVVAAFTFVQPAFCEHPDLSGVWQLDVAASAFGAMPASDSGMLTISTGPHKMLHMEVVLKGKVERTDDTDWKIDDRYHPVIGDELGVSLAKWEGSVLVGKRHTEAGMEEIRLVPGADGVTMVESIESSQGRTTLTWRRR